MTVLNFDRSTLKGVRVTQAFQRFLMAQSWNQVHLAFDFCGHLSQESVLQPVEAEKLLLFFENLVREIKN